MAWVRARLCKLQKRCTRLAATSDKVHQLLAHGRWFSPGTPASSQEVHKFQPLKLPGMLSQKVSLSLYVWDASLKHPSLKYSGERLFIFIRIYTKIPTLSEVNLLAVPFMWKLLEVVPASVSPIASGSEDSTRADKILPWHDWFRLPLLLLALVLAIQQSTLPK